MKRALAGLAVGGIVVALAAGIAVSGWAEDAPQGKETKKGRALGEKFLERRFAKLDKNGDGVLTQEEFPRPEMFDAADADKDGRVTMEEAKNALRSHIKDRVQGAAGQALGARLKKLDTDGDGKISKAEFDAAFTKLDKDGDGFITEDEIKASVAGHARGKEGHKKVETKKAE